MQDSVLTLGDLIAIVIAFLTVSGAGWAIWIRITTQIKEVKESAYLKSDAANLRAETALRELAEHKTHVAENYISKAGFRETMDSLSETLKTINANLIHLNERIDRVIDNQHGQAKRGGQQ